MRLIAGVTPEVRSSTQTNAAIARIQQLEKTNRELEARLCSEEGENRHLREQARMLRALRPDVLIGDFEMEVPDLDATREHEADSATVVIDPEIVVAAINAHFNTPANINALEADVYARWKKRAKA
jgi:hypothetical protein